MDECPVDTPLEQLVEDARKHYRHLSDMVCYFNSTIERGLGALLKVAQLEAELKIAHTRIAGYEAVEIYCAGIEAQVEKLRKMLHTVEVKD